MNKNNGFFYFKCALYSLIVYICTSWLLLYDSSSVIWVRYICYSTLLWSLLDKNKADGANTHCQIMIVASMVAAVLLLELPVRIVYFCSSIGSIPALVGTIMTIILPLWFYNQRKIWVFVVIVIILTLICTIGLEKWDEVYWMYRGSEVEKLKREALGGM